MRVSEWIAIVYFLCVILLLFFSSLAWRRRILVLLSSSALIALLLLLPYGERLSSPQFLPVARDCLPLLMILSAYYQAGLLISARRDHAWEQRLLAWDKTLLEKSWLHRLRASARWLEQFGEGAYLLCYLVVPLAIPILYLARQQDLVDQFWSAVLPAVLLCYGVSPFFPSLPPRSSAPGLHLPGKSLFLRRVNLWVLKYGSIQSTIFPSAHVAAATATALALSRVLPLVGALYLVIAIGIALGSVFGRYHYAADSILGVLAGVAGFALSGWLFPP